MKPLLSILFILTLLLSSHQAFSAHPGCIEKTRKKNHDSRRRYYVCPYEEKAKNESSDRRVRSERCEELGGKIWNHAYIGSTKESKDYACIDLDVFNNIIANQKKEAVFNTLEKALLAREAIELAKKSPEEMKVRSLAEKKFLGIYNRIKISADDAEKKNMTGIMGGTCWGAKRIREASEIAIHDWKFVNQSSLKIIETMKNEVNEYKKKNADPNVKNKTPAQLYSLKFQLSYNQKMLGLLKKVKPRYLEHIEKFSVALADARLNSWARKQRACNEATFDPARAGSAASVIQYRRIESSIKEYEKNITKLKGLITRTNNAFGNDAPRYADNYKMNALPSISEKHQIFKDAIQQAVQNQYNCKDKECDTKGIDLKSITLPETGMSTIGNQTTRSTMTNSNQPVAKLKFANGDKGAFNKRNQAQNLKIPNQKISGKSGISSNKGNSNFKSGTNSNNPDFKTSGALTNSNGINNSLDSVNVNGSQSSGKNSNVAEEPGQRGLAVNSKLATGSKGGIGSSGKKGKSRGQYYDDYDSQNMDESTIDRSQDDLFQLSEGNTNNENVNSINMNRELSLFRIISNRYNEHYQGN